MRKQHQKGSKSLNCKKQNYSIMNNKINIFLLLVIIFFGVSCSTTSFRIELMKPAHLNISKKIKTVAVINRSLPKSKAGGFVEGILTGETLWQDKKGTEQTLRGIIETMGQSNRFTVINTGKSFVGSTFGNVFPDALAWSKIESLCAQYNADAILSLEAYDSDFIITNTSKEVTKTNEDGKSYKTTEYYASGVAKVYLGYRLHDPKIRSIIDQKTFSFNNKWKAKGSTVEDAIEHLIDRSRAVNSVSYNAGIMYAKRIVPVYVWVSRQYFKKAKDNNHIEIGARKAKVNDWEGAIDEWKLALNSTTQKTLGRASYNLAVGYEMQNEFRVALEWAKKSYSNYNNKDAYRYVRILENRIEDQKRLDEQLNN